MEAFVGQEGKLIPAAEYLQQARQAGQPARAPVASRNQLVSVFGRFTVEGAWEGKSWEERIIPRFVDLDSGLEILPSYGFFAEGSGAASRSSDGWFRIQLYPGSYVVGLAPRVENPRRSFRVNVSADAKDLYIGSFRIKCIGRERGLGVYPLSCSDDIAVTLENSVAAQRMDVDAGTLVSVPTGPYGGSLDGAIAALPNQVQLRKRWR